MRAPLPKDVDPEPADARKLPRRVVVGELVDPLPVALRRDELQRDLPRLTPERVVDQHLAAQGLTRLGDQPVVVVPDQDEPHLVLRSGDGRVAGFDGCNRLMGSYSIDGTAIAFGQMASTMMACPDEMEIGVGFAEALGAAVRFRLLAHHLELLDRDGATLARFEAREMKN